MPPLKKRKLRSSAEQNAIDIASLRKTVYTRNLGEIKHLTGHLPTTQVTNGNANIQILTGIGTGANQGQRIGNEIRVKSIEVSGFLGTNTVDCYLIQSKTGEAPVIANFTPTKLGHLTQGTSQDHFRILNTNHTSRSYNDYYFFTFKHTFNIPMKVTYTGPTSTEISRNQLYLVVINRSGANQNIEWSSTLRYID